ncbi:MAG: AAA family ATPase, partial [Candidatus Adiutrix sp.]
DSPERLKAGILYKLNEKSLEGHSFYPEDDLLKEAMDLLGENQRPKLQVALNGLMLSGLIKREAGEVPDEAAIYLPRLHRAENWVAKSISDMVHRPPTITVPRVDKAIAWAEGHLGLELSCDQRRAVEMALNKKVAIITGGPGTGKTTITKVITAIYMAMKAKIALVAPTGRAAKRLSQATGLLGLTIHRLLEYVPQAGGFIRGPKNKLDLDLILIDEVSMLDLSLTNSLIGALPHHARLIFVGDPDQLPSVGPGRVLADLLSSGLIDVVTLSEVHRQAENSQIVKAARQINQGLFPASSHDRNFGDFYFIEEKDSRQILNKMVYLISKKLPEKLGVDPMEDIQVLT